ncbi:DUF3348 family protein [Noviherbaspirillum denitrificans]|uniref:DUF3348 domain-containing protein n=1 Tax=Noviherbaspirillum denitrificans TaxID=1968433 RepID=A0A254TFX7_9BURK|nr:DUF3348 family protein [Noviherbaspirillum denitrificans]OWW21559.1 hypothetical protein AYR66_20765 [Noviherbaspirillum denitrificans]
MTRELPRTNFHGSNLIRCLADLALVDTADAGKAFAEELGHWVHFADAIRLSAVHGDGLASFPKMQAEALDTARAAAVADFERIQAFLTNSIVKSCALKPGKSHIALPPPPLELPLDLATAYPPYRRFHEAHQRDMELTIQPLRVNVREAVAKASPRLRKLAELDVALERVLREREGKLLAKVPVLLRKHFAQLYKDHQKALADTQQADNPAAWMRAGGWLARFCSDMQMLLLAELDLRLQPAMGLIEAFRQDTQ